jgi:hypothetical protein
MPSLSNNLYRLPIPPVASWDSIAGRAGERASEPAKLTSPSSRNPQTADTDAGQPLNGDGKDTANPWTMSDVAPDNYWTPGANYAAEHDEFPQANYKRMPPDTRKVFDRAATGELFLGLDGRRHEYDAFHREYNKATGELLKRFMMDNNIAGPEQMTPDHARAVLKAIAESDDRRIRDYREYIRRLRMFYRLRTGRGTE